MTHFLAEICQKEQQQKRFGERALRALELYPFPGNVRELRNAVQQAFILAEGEIDVEHLPEGMRGGGRAAASPGGAAQPTTAPGEVRLQVPCALADAERSVILATLGELGGDKARAADHLGISLKTLYSRLREYGARDRD